MPKRTDIIPEITENMSPMMRQYVEIKRQNPDSILFFRLGDFYEMFFNDAKIASEELDIALTKRASGEDDKAPMCGVPYHSCESYISRLIKKGYRVSVCEQTEDPSKTKKLVSREVVRVITPGTVMNEAMLETSKNNYLATVYFDGTNASCCFVDISTSELNLTTLDPTDAPLSIINELTKFQPRELLITTLAYEEKRIRSFLS